MTHFSEWQTSVTPDLGAWDYKKKFGDRNKDKAHYEALADFGNFNYAVTGKAAGFSSIGLLFLGGIKELQKDIPNAIKGERRSDEDPNSFFPPCFGDEADDCQTIQDGFSYWNRIRSCVYLFVE